MCTIKSVPCSTEKATFWTTLPNLKNLLFERKRLNYLFLLAFYVFLLSCQFWSYVIDLTCFFGQRYIHGMLLFVTALQIPITFPCPSGCMLIQFSRLNLAQSPPHIKSSISVTTCKSIHLCRVWNSHKTNCNLQLCTPGRKVDIAHNAGIARNSY